MSDFVVHLTRESQPTTAYKNIINICWMGKIKAINRHGVARKIIPPPPKQEVVCFSEIPLTELSRLSQRYKSSFGIGFTKKYMRDKGGAPIWYLPNTNQARHAINELMKTAKSPNLSNEPIWKITPFIDLTGQFKDKSYEFQWEREWRHIGDFEFEVQDVAFLIIPESLQIAVESTLPSDEGCPYYNCPMIDPFWDGSRINSALKL